MKKIYLLIRLQSKLSKNETYRLSTQLILDIRKGKKYLSTIDSSDKKERIFFFIIQFILSLFLFLVKNLLLLDRTSRK